MLTCSSGRQYADMQFRKAVHAAQESGMDTHTYSSGRQYADMQLRKAVRRHAPQRDVYDGARKGECF